MFEKPKNLFLTLNISLIYNNPLKRNFIEDLINHGLLSYLTQDSAFKDNTKCLEKHRWV